MDEILIVGGGIGGLTLALGLAARRIPHRVFEAAPEMRPVGVGVNLLPHATRVLAALGLDAYGAERLGPTTRVVLENRRTPPDAILREVYERTGDRPFARIEDVIGKAELKAISERYQRVSGYDRATLKRKEAAP